MPVIVGVGAGLLGGTMEIVSALLKKPFIKWPGDLGVFVVFIASISFLWASMPQYAKLLYSLSDYEEKVKKLMAKSNQSFVEFVQLIAKTLEAKDQYTAGHSQRVKEYSLLIADSMNLPKEDIELLEKACLLHDIGKLSIPEGVLNKKTPLTKKEWQYVLKHPVAGKELLNMVSDFQDIISIIYAHHERVDGKGYPNGQTNENIPLLARIIAVADVYDAMLSERPYRKAKTKPEAIEELNKVKGTQLDEVIVSKFVELITAQVL
jgi:putative nucleotidyltransferase with HDIG domain